MFDRRMRSHVLSPPSGIFHFCFFFGSGSDERAFGEVAGYILWTYCGDAGTFFCHAWKGRVDGVAQRMWVGCIA